MKAVIFKPWHEPTPAQIKAGNYAKRKVQWQGFTISIENEAGSVRRGTARDGTTWEQRMPFAYGYAKGTEGVDGDHVDIFLGPNLDAPMVYVVHQRKYGDWEAYDEDKCMCGFASEDDARAAFLASYSDPRFLGPITAMPVAEFVEKARATKEAPAMIKAILFFKSRVDPYIRGGRIVRGYDNRKVKRSGPDTRQRTFMFAQAGDHLPTPPAETGETKKYYVTMVRDPGPRQRVAFLAGPFDTHEESLAHVELARKKAEEVDPRAAFDAFGTAARTAKEHPAGKLNAHLGIASRPASS